MSKIIKSEDYTSKTKGRKIAYVADTRHCIGMVNLANNSDILISESTLILF